VTKWAKLGQNWPKLAKIGQNWPKLAQKSPIEPNSIEVPIVIVETCPFGSKHRFDWYDHPQGIFIVTLIPYRHPDGQFGAVIKEMLFHGER
jgi:hypothetical protein